VTSGDVAEALDDMLFTGGRLNMRLLGARRSSQPPKCGAAAEIAATRPE
jgi:hypothetical protein